MRGLTRAAKGGLGVVLVAGRHDTGRPGVDRGEEPGIGLIHGLMGQMRNFAPDPAELLAESHQVVLVDRPGSGYSAPLPPGHDGISGQADAIAALIERI